MPPRHAYTQAPTAPGPASYTGRASRIVGDEMYLWLLLAIELILTGWLRIKFRSAHGG